jgi:hypothetical protein
MPFPGSQRSDTINIAYFLNKYIFYIRLATILLVLLIVYKQFHGWKKWQKIFFLFVISLYAVVFYFFNFKFLADKMFYQPKNKNFADIVTSKIPLDKLVIGVTINNESRAYPVEIIGYHHQVQDTVGSEPIMVTYCTVCRTGRVFSPFINGKKESFRLVGMDHFNAMFEDKATKSWWRQVTGQAITGPLKGMSLKEIPSEQISLSAWLRANPNSLILQPDSVFKKQYEGLKGFDKGTIKSSLEKKDSGSWKFKSWVIGIKQDNGTSKAYDWNELVEKKIINDSLPGLPVLLVIEPDSASWHLWNRSINSQTLLFKMENNELKDTSGSVWNFDGLCLSGPLKGQQLKQVPASQEFWHSWHTFHPGTTTYNYNSSKSIR